MNELKNFYQANVASEAKKSRYLTQRIFLIATARLVCFLLITFFTYQYLHNKEAYCLRAAGILSAVFLWLVSVSARLTYQKALSQKLLFINENEISAMEGNNAFDNGSLYQTGESYFADLDIFGNGSLYYLLNRTSTIHGSTTMADLLKNPFTDRSVILEYQQAIKTFASQHPVREMVVAKSLLHSKTVNGISGLETWILQPAVLLTNTYMQAARYIFPALNMALIFQSLYSGQYYLLSLSVIITWLHIGYFSKHTNSQHMLIGKREEILKQYAEVLQSFEKANSEESVVIQRMQSKCRKAHTQINNLSRWANLLDQRLNLLVTLLLNSVLMYEIQCVFGLENWKKHNSQHLAEWMSNVGEIECLASFATFAFNHPDYIYPTIAEAGLILEGEDLAHPLMKGIQTVTNPVSLGAEGRLMLITGSNMSGKTTFLRTVGVNTLLAQCGAPVFASRFHFSPFHIYSSIRISDSLQENTSYFMAELKRLHYIKQRIAGMLPSLVLIDEILRGTNSDDKYYGSEQFMLQLIRYNCLTLFATHDLKLSQLQVDQPGIILNYCFESTIQNDELFFDYKIRRGVAQNKNASFLMKKMEII